MNIAIFETCNQASNIKKEKIEIRPTITFVPKSTVEAERTDKNKDEFISVTYRYRSKNPVRIQRPNLALWSYYLEANERKTS